MRKIQIILFGKKGKKDTEKKKREKEEKEIATA